MFEQDLSVKLSMSCNTMAVVSVLECSRLFITVCTRYRQEFPESRKT